MSALNKSIRMHLLSTVTMNEVVCKDVAFAYNGNEPGGNTEAKL